MVIIMLRKIIVVVFVLFSLCFVSAKSIDERTFMDIGFEDYDILRGKEECIYYDLGKIETEQNYRFFVNLKLANYIPVKNDLEIGVTLNDLKKTIKNDEILEENLFEFTNIKKEKNSMVVCVNNNALPKVIISKNSTFGTYLIGEIKENVDFYQKILTSTTYNSTLIPIEIYAHNSGDDSLFININHANEIFLRNSNLETVSGQTNYSGQIAAGQTIILKYFLKANRNIDFALPAAELKYTDEFGREIVLSAKQEIIKIRDNENKIEVYVDLKRNAIVGHPLTGNIILKNVSPTNIKNVFIESHFDGKIVVSERHIPILKKYTVIEIPFEISVDEAGQYNLNMTVYYNVGEKENGVSAQTIIVNAEPKKDYVKEIIGIFLIITIGIYVWVVKL